MYFHIHLQICSYRVLNKKWTGIMQPSTESVGKPRNYLLKTYFLLFHISYRLANRLTTCMREDGVWHGPKPDMKQLSITADWIEIFVIFMKMQEIKISESYNISSLACGCHLWLITTLLLQGLQSSFSCSKNGSEIHSCLQGIPMIIAYKYNLQNNIWAVVCLFVYFQLQLSGFIFLNFYSHYEDYTYTNLYCIRWLSYYTESQNF